MPNPHWFNSLIGGWVSRTVKDSRVSDDPFKNWGSCFHGEFHYSTGRNKLLSTCLFVTPNFLFHIIEKFSHFSILLAFIVPSHHWWFVNPSWWVDRLTQTWISHHSHRVTSHTRCLNVWPEVCAEVNSQGWPWALKLEVYTHRYKHKHVCWLTKLVAPGTCSIHIN